MFWHYASEVEIATIDLRLECRLRNDVVAQVRSAAEETEYCNVDPTGRAVKSRKPSASAIPAPHH